MTFSWINTPVAAKDQSEEIRKKIDEITKIKEICPREGVLCAGEIIKQGKKRVMISYTQVSLLSGDDNPASLCTDYLKGSSIHLDF